LHPIVVIFCWLPRLKFFQEMQNGSSSSSPGGQHFFVHACKIGSLAHARTLFDKGIDVNWKDKEGYTALMWASGKGQVGIVKWLLSRGVLIDIQNKCGGTASGVTALMWSSQEGHVEVVKLLLDRGALPDLQEPNHGSTALIMASSWGRASCVRLLLEKGADMSLKDKNGMTAKDIAKINGHIDIIQLLDEVRMFQTQDKYFKYRQT
jgi:ankyrin repeat protein